MVISLSFVEPGVLRLIQMCTHKIIIQKANETKLASIELILIDFTRQKWKKNKNKISSNTFDLCCAIFKLMNSNENTVCGAVRSHLL